MTSRSCIVITTAGDEAEAKRLAELLITQKMAACVQYAPIKSVYEWEGDIEYADEYRLCIKTTAAGYARVEAALLQHHSYATPEIIRLPIEGGSKAYLDWVDAAVSDTL